MLVKYFTQKDDEESKTYYSESGDVDDIDAEIYKLTGKEGDAESSKSETVDLIHPNEVLKALRSFVDDHRKPQRYILLCLLKCLLIFFYLNLFIV